MTLRVRFSSAASKQYKKLGNIQRKEKIALSLEHIAKSPFVGKPLQGEFEGDYSYRVGDFRIIYYFDKEEQIIVVIRIDHRKDVYR